MVEESYSSAARELLKVALPEDRSKLNDYEQRLKNTVDQIISRDKDETTQPGNSLSP
jgi:hypothetical protein